MSTASPAPASAISPRPAASRPWLALALTFLFLGIGYALPVPLAPAPPPGMWQGSIAPEVLNLYALTVYAGWAHFFYAWRGQFFGTTRLPRRSRTLYWIAVALGISLLVLARSLLGAGLFSALVWIWFIGHFVRAELFFASRSANTDPQRTKGVSWQPVLAFAWLTLVLFNAAGIDNHRWLLFTGCVAVALTTLLTGGWRHLSQGTSFLPAVALFFAGEAFVWGAYEPYMHPAFRVGVYVFHVAGASFFHYLGSYAYGQNSSSSDRWLRIGAITAVNLAIIGICSAIAWTPALHRLLPLFGLEWFTLWVAAHLAASDLLPIWKRRSTPADPIR
jgi:hypothetical protein